MVTNESRGILLDGKSIAQSNCESSAQSSGESSAQNSGKSCAQSKSCT